MKKVFLMVSFLVLQSCTTSPVYYKQYTGNQVTGTSTLEGVSIIGTLGYGYVSPYVIRVNDVFCKPDYPKCEGIELLPGKYKIKIGIENISFYSDTTIELMVENNHKYIIKSEEAKPDYNAPINTENVWLIDSSSNTKIMKIEDWSIAKSKPPITGGTIYIRM